MSIIANALLAGSVLASGLTGAAPAADTAPVQSPAIEQHAEIDQRAMTTFQTFATLSGNRVAHHLNFKGDTNTDHTGRTANYVITSPSGKTIASGTGSIYSIPDIGQPGKISHTTYTEYFDFTGYLNGTYTVTYSYVAGGETHTSSKSVTLNR